MIFSKIILFIHCQQLYKICETLKNQVDTQCRNFCTGFEIPGFNQDFMNECSQKPLRWNDHFVTNGVCGLSRAKR